MGHSAAQIAEHIPSGCRTVLNENWEAGLSSSIKAGLGAIDRTAEAALFVLADQPNITSEALECILQAYYSSTTPIVVPMYHGQRGTPALFDRCLFPELETLHGDIGGREIIKRFAHKVTKVEMQSPEMFLDIDTPADYKKFVARTKQT